MPYFYLVVCKYGLLFCFRIPCSILLPLNLFAKIFAIWLTLNCATYTDVLAIFLYAACNKFWNTLVIKYIVALLSTWQNFVTIAKNVENLQEDLTLPSKIILILILTLLSIFLILKNLVLHSLSNQPLVKKYLCKVYMESIIHMLD